MVEHLASLEQPKPRARTGLTEIVIPIYNEEEVLSASVHRLDAYLTENFPYPYRITIADNGSTDGSWEVATSLVAALPNVHAQRLEQKGRGRALRHVWSRSEADIVCYTDVDLSIDLDAFLPLVAPLLSGHSDLAIGTRYAQGSSVARSVKRAVLSRGYNFLLRSTMGARFSDAQCGFKAGRREIIQALLPAVDDNKWFFDTELLLVAQRHGLRIHEVPVDCLDDPNSSVDLVRTAYDDVRGMARVARRMIGNALHVPLPPRVERATLPPGLARQLPRFAIIGVLSTIAYVLLYLWLRTFLPALGANAVALISTAVVNTAANRRFTFGVRGAADAIRHQLEGGVDLVVRLAFTSGGVLLLNALWPGVSETVELIVVYAVAVLATGLRFLLLRNWVFHPKRLRA
ncbi:bifunctional glycosyltransferase family 2/GtrA family protein [Amycolatopsis suaedae]|uniref:dolichyl-phosphate beta-glucosyltransferase n=1 Tax=Amycolatopsis suaedae TaxID=2510978 RepID=A0A4V2ELC4_9PSEU|nr:bifunctional glycosyltransferase family 2/GtrA family protein [Amycolatopsis suaedae]RZQ61075.1 glycosyltransferase [Amycolatopsis suaedae]